MTCENSCIMLLSGSKDQAFRPEIDSDNVIGIVSSLRLQTFNRKSALYTRDVEFERYGHSPGGRDLI